MSGQGAVVGVYRLERELGRGGQGAVHAARHLELGTLVALKLLEVQGPQELQRFRQEAQVLARLSHPHLPRVTDLGQAGRTAYLAMELIEGEELKTLVRRRGRLTPAEAARLLAPVARAVAYCHAQGVLHRDLKPHNVVLERATGRPVLIDFGLLKRDAQRFGAQQSVDELVRLSQTGELKGTPGYMAPEQAMGEPVGPPADVYALGATLHFLLTGQAPIEGQGLYELLSRTLQDPPSDPRRLAAGIPAALAELCLAAQARDPAARPSAAAFAERLEQASARPARSPAGALALAILALGGLTAAGLVLTRSAGDVAEPAPERPVEAAPAASLAAPAPAVETAAALPPQPLPEPLPEGEHPRETAPPPLSAGEPVVLRAPRPEGPLPLPPGPPPLPPWPPGPAPPRPPRPGPGPDPQSPAVRSVERVTEAERRRERGDEEGALRALREAIELAPDNAVAWMERGRLRARREEYDLAIADFGQAIELLPSAPLPLALRGEAYLESGRSSQAVPDLQRATELEPGLWRAHMSLGLALGNLTRYEESLEPYAQALRRAPTRAAVAVIRQNRAYALQQLRRWDESLRDYDHVAEAEPDLWVGHHGRAQALLGLGRLTEARQAAERALQVQDHPEVRKKVEPLLAEIRARSGE